MDAVDVVSCLIVVLGLFFVVICVLYVFGKIFELVGNLWICRKLKLKGGR